MINSALYHLNFKKLQNLLTDFSVTAYSKIISFVCLKVRCSEYRNKVFWPSLCYTIVLVQGNDVKSYGNWLGLYKREQRTTIEMQYTIKCGNGFIIVTIADQLCTVQQISWRNELFTYLIKCLNLWCLHMESTFSAPLMERK
jgi:hypothetical protein